MHKEDKFRNFISWLLIFGKFLGLPLSGSWQDLKDHMREGKTLK
jgi:hypothetical protein